MKRQRLMVLRAEASKSAFPEEPTTLADKIFCLSPYPFYLILFLFRYDITSIYLFHKPALFGMAKRCLLRFLVPSIRFLTTSIPLLYPALEFQISSIGCERTTSLWQECSCLPPTCPGTTSTSMDLGGSFACAANAHFTNPGLSSHLLPSNSVISQRRNCLKLPKRKNNSFRSSQTQSFSDLNRAKG